MIIKDRFQWLPFNHLIIIKAREKNIKISSQLNISGSEKKEHTVTQEGIQIKIYASEWSEGVGVCTKKLLKMILLNILLGCEKCKGSREIFIIRESE